MKTVLENLLRLQPQNMLPTIWALMILLWIVVVGLGCFSIFAQPIPRGLKILWVLVVSLLPLVGMLLYCLFCLVCVDYRTVLGFFKMRKPLPDGRTRAS